VSLPPSILPGTLAASAQPVLTTPTGLTLRPWEAADAPVFLSAYDDPAIQQWHPRHPASEAQVLEWFDLYHSNWTLERGASWAVTRTGVVVGRIALGNFDLHAGIAVCAYWVLPFARGTGVAPSALSAVSTWAFASGFERLHLSHSTRNTPSCRAATKGGFPLEGTKRNEAPHADGRHDMHLHARIPSDK
jgi:RimJ/RimL family protein N-acetyltransferase